ncbi:GrdX family protein [Spongorhabdus nitratireducens]
MARKLLVITNNPRVQDKFAAISQHQSESYEQVLHQVRNRVHAGAKVLTHPLAGSVKPGESPYRSVCIDDQEGVLDMRSLEVIESAIDRFNTLISCSRQRIYDKKTLEDFQLIDYQLLKSGLDAIDPALTRDQHID